MRKHMRLGRRKFWEWLCSRTTRSCWPAASTTCVLQHHLHTCKQSDFLPIAKKKKNWRQIGYLSDCLEKFCFWTGLTFEDFVQQLVDVYLTCRTILLWHFFYLFICLFVLFTIVRSSHIRMCQNRLEAKVSWEISSVLAFQEISRRCLTFIFLKYYSFYFSKF
jgi:hypothetical protein